MKTHPLPIYLQRFFSERLAMQLHASPNTVASYRETFRLLLKYAADRLVRAPTALQIADIDADLVGDFLTFVETTAFSILDCAAIQSRSTAAAMAQLLIPPS
jgi:hypothetical protein